MKIEIIESTGDWKDEPVTSGYHFEPHWLDQMRLDSDSYKRFVVRDSKEGEVARVELDISVTREGLRASSYDISEIGTDLVEIQFIDVKESFRSRGLGTQIVRSLEDEYRHYQLVALAKPGSEKFWRSIGWSHIFHSDPPRFEMFVSPEPTLN